jgi:hypothetical protein
MSRKAKFQKPKAKAITPIARPLELVQPAKRLSESLRRKEANVDGQKRKPEK